MNRIVPRPFTGPLAAAEHHHRRRSPRLRKPADLTIGQLLDHTSGLGEATKGGPPARTLADLLPRILESGINMAAHIVEVVSGQSFDVFLEQRTCGSIPLRASPTSS